MNLENIRLAGVVALAVAYAGLFVCEQVFPLRRRTAPLPPRLLANLALTAVVFLVAGTVVRTVGVRLAGWTSEKSFGLLPVLRLPAGAQFVLGFLLMDLTFYYWHRANHEVPILWRFHNVHHIDHDLDVTTSFRFHFVEIFYSVGFRAIQVLAIGAAPMTYVIYEAAFTAETIFHHSNVRLPIAWERAINWVVVTPRMHGIHHSVIKGETNSNYGTVFRWWDWLHRTLGLNVPQSQVRIGVAAYQEREDNTLWELVGAPFRAQREYWRLSDGLVPERGPQERAGKPTVLSE